MSLWSSIFGSSHGQRVDLSDPSTQALANQAFNTAYNHYSQSLSNAGQLANQSSPYAQQQMMTANAYNNLLAQQQYNANRQTYEWVWNGKPCSITEFAELAYGDTAQKTMFLLKHSDKKET